MLLVVALRFSVVADNDRSFVKTVLDIREDVCKSVRLVAACDACCCCGVGAYGGVAVHDVWACVRMAVPLLAFLAAAELPPLTIHLKLSLSNTVRFCGPNGPLGDSGGASADPPAFLFLRCNSYFLRHCRRDERKLKHTRSVAVWIFRNWIFRLFPASFWIFITRGVVCMFVIES